MNEKYIRYFRITNFNHFKLNDRMIFPSFIQPNIILERVWKILLKHRDKYDEF